METAKNKWLGIFDEAEENVIAAGIILMVLMETVNTIFKFAYPSAAGLPEELANFAYTWVACFYAASFCTKRSANSLWMRLQTCIRKHCGMSWNMYSMSLILQCP